MSEGLAPTKDISVTVADAAFPKPFYQGLEFNSPAHGGWNIVHIGMLLPGARQIYVCSANCMRGVVLTAAEMNASDRFSFVLLDEADMTMGSIENATIDGVCGCLDMLDEKPPVVLLFTVCVHHFLGCDLDYVYRKLKEKYPDIFFVRCYMDPLLQKTRPTPDQKLRMAMYDPISPLPVNRHTVSIIGTELPMYKSSDIYRIIELVSGQPAANAYTRSFNPILESLAPDYINEYVPGSRNNSRSKAAGSRDAILLRELPTCTSYQDYLAIGESALLLAMNPVAVMGLNNLGERLSRPVLYLPMSFSCVEITRAWMRLADAVAGCCDGIQTADTDSIKKLLASVCENMARECDAALGGALGIIGDTELRIDAAFHTRPLGLARLLLEHGFNVSTIYLDLISPEEKEDLEWLRLNKPGLVLHSTVQPECRTRERTSSKVLAIGQKAAWFSGTGHFVDGAQGAGLWGFDGIIRLARLLADAYINEKDTKKLIIRKGWGCSSCV